MTGVLPKLMVRIYVLLALASMAAEAHHIQPISRALNCSQSIDKLTQTLLMSVPAFSAT